jgi:uridine phosphorylase
LIDRALRDEGTSYHYLPPGEFSMIQPVVGELIAPVLADAPVVMYQGATWTTDAPFRETEAAIHHAQQLGLLAVEMEAAALYAFAETRQAAVACFAHVTNQMARSEGDFEKGAANGSEDALRLIGAVVERWLQSPQ